MSEELKHCKCGKPPTIVDPNDQINSYIIYCRNVKNGPHTDAVTSKHLKSAIQAWNRRVESE